MGKSSLPELLAKDATQIGTGLFEEEKRRGDKRRISRKLENLLYRSETRITEDRDGAAGSSTPTFARNNARAPISTRRGRKGETPL